MISGSGRSRYVTGALGELICFAKSFAFSLSHSGGCFTPYFVTRPVDDELLAPAKGPLHPATTKPSAKTAEPAASVRSYLFAVLCT
jgi:hypothetical protein